MQQGILQGSSLRKISVPASPNRYFNRSRSVEANNFSSASAIINNNNNNSSNINNNIPPSLSSLAEQQTYEKLPLSLFKDPSAARYICSLCQNVPLTCSSCDRGHIFCKNCLLQLVQSNSHCPVDNELIKKHNILHGNLILDNIIANSIVFCVYANANEFEIGEDSIEGGGAGQRAGNTAGEHAYVDEQKQGYNKKEQPSCPWEGPVSKFVSHIKQCTYKPIECPYANIGCKLSMNNTHMNDNILDHQELLLHELLKLRNEVKYLRIQQNKGSVVYVQQQNAPVLSTIVEIEEKKAPLFDIEQNILIGVGCNEKGEMGNNTDVNVTQVGKLEWSKNKNIIAMFSCAYKAFAYLDIQQNIYVCGCNDYGGIGIGHEDDQRVPLMHPYFVKQKIKIVTVSKSIASFHVFFIADTGIIYASGANEKGQLGLGDEEHRNTVTEVKSLTNKRIIDICCGAEHSLFLANNGKVYACGSNEGFQLGVVTKSMIRRKPIPIALEVSVSQISCGRTHSYLLDTNGSVWSFGSNAHGQLGVEKSLTNRQKAPIKINYFSENNCRIMKCASGNDHGCALDSNGNIYVWGRGEEGQIGNGKKKDKYLPNKLDFFSNKRISDIFCGCHHTVVLTLENRVFCWGNNRYNQCNDEYQGKFDTDHRPVTKPKELYKSMQIVDILAGSYHTLLILNADLEIQKKAKLGI